MSKKRYLSTINNQLSTMPRRGFSVLEIILAMGLFTIIISGAVGTVIQSFSAIRLGGEKTKATLLAAEGLEAVRAIRGRDVALVPGTYGLSAATGRWEFLGTSNSIGRYTREIVVSDVYRDVSGNVVESGGSLDPNTKRVTAVVDWDFSPTRPNSVSLPTYFTCWSGTICNWAVAQQFSYDLNAPRNAFDVKIDGNYLYTVTNNEEFYILDISTPSSPQFVGRDTFHIPFFQVGLYGIALSGNYAYVASQDIVEWFPWAAEVAIVDISDPASPSHTLYSIPGPNIVYDVAASDNYLYVVTGENSSEPEFTILDISNPTSPVRVGWFEVGSRVNAVYISDDRAYITTDLNTMELMVIDITNRSNPQLVGSYDVPSASGDGTDVFVVGSTAYLVTEENDGATPEFCVLDVFNPASIQLVGSFDVSGNVNGLAIGEGYAFLATERDDAEALVIDISDPSAPVVETAVNLPDDANAVAIGVCVAFYATDTDSGEVRILEP